MCSVNGISAVTRRKFKLKSELGAAIHCFKHNMDKHDS